MITFYVSIIGVRGLPGPIGSKGDKGDHGLSGQPGKYESLKNENIDNFFYDESTIYSKTVILRF